MYKAQSRTRNRKEHDHSIPVPNPAIGGKEGEIEVRQLFELEDFGPSEAVERFREMGVGAKK
jgi:hypothetical protein